MPANENDPPVLGASFQWFDPHGQAALLLVESLIHGLCENSKLSADQAIDITERALDVQSDLAEAAEGAAAAMWKSHALLSAILASLKMEGCDPPLDRKRKP